ncbi:hypothetical protein IAQ61_001355 [Plenodomus lingam]|uniref:Secreted protein n=1 Tax=Leptosphaeria maculans (strain JN3 / isolate v23.1.3 / race Av1-4-5-6-7-8) TaxID=985895 RepID=E4ZXT6_LEPMJ|nr:hypothetical protein LEMA_P111000.1 [Plenodomus lingam JN3]KAH9879537.1 hypothetical protein IAQ61_001355 [Plenodomus lingam]CBX96181.1 hypothetical protein LEMA_P111000.1 [Plenodomus lingam JN3]
MKFFVLTVLVGSAFGGPTLSVRQNATCDMEKVTQLAGGIQANLFVQQQELAGIKCLQKLEPNQASSQFPEERQRVLAIQQLGINIRAQNQNLAKDINSPAIDGLNVVEGAQITEMRQVMGLTGDGEKDKDVLETLVKEVEDGTKQNEANLAAAQGQCKSE